MFCVLNMVISLSSGLTNFILALLQLVSAEILSRIFYFSCSTACRQLCSCRATAFYITWCITIFPNRYIWESQGVPTTCLSDVTFGLRRLWHGEAFSTPEEKNNMTTAMTNEGLWEVDVFLKVSIASLTVWILRAYSWTVACLVAQLQLC